MISFNGSSSTVPVGVYVAVGRTRGGATTFETPVRIAVSTEDYQRLDSLGRNRWGDYSATTVDPSDPSRFWTHHLIIPADNVWATQITKLILRPACAANCNGDADPVTGRPLLSVADFTCFQNAFALGDLAKADVGGPASCSPHGLLCLVDFTCFQNLFALGCP